VIALGHDGLSSAEEIEIGTHPFDADTADTADTDDTDDTGEIVLTDVVYVLLHLFQGGPEPPPPYPNRGVDPTADDLP